ncbi:MAG: DUF4012 domain-containing protein [Chloroflexi bacterium]|nr:DUF4012 domain-containing protein [Chloroflexota bacterium]
MKNKQDDFLALKNILENAHQPGQIDSHPWTESLFVRETVAGMPALARESPGRQLVAAVSRLFLQMMPSMPPRRGKRLDPRWGEFGLLAAKYFAPLGFGIPFPTTMRDTWGRIDESILLFVQSKAGVPPTEEQIARYSLVSGELEDGPASTMSDWHRKGIQRLLDIILAHERYLESVMAAKSVLLHPPDESTKRSVPGGNQGDRESKKAGKSRRRNPFRLLWTVVAAGVLFAVIWGGIKARRVYLLAEKLRQDVVDAQVLLGDSSVLDSVTAAAPLMVGFGDDLDALQKEVEPVFWLTDRLGWVPVYGGDLASARDLMELAALTVRAAEKTYSAMSPMLQLFEDEKARLTLPEITSLLMDVQPELSSVQASLDQVFAVRADIDPQQLSPEVRDLLVGKFDPLLGLMDDGLSLALALPRVLGASNEGPKTYLLLVENEDELRPTGGFITAVGNLVVQDGQIVSLSFEDSGIQEDWTKPYPSAPWQLQEYMNSRVLILRDSNWFTNFPTAALYAEYLYSYTHAHSVDGVIAFDQQMLVMLLDYLGPVDVDGAPGPVTAGNVIAYMRAAKVPPPEGFRQPGEDRKEFIAKIANAVLGKMLDDGVSDWESLGRVFIRVLDERHLLLQFDDETMTKILAEYGWDGALRVDEGDFLMVVDSNVGFNKTNAVVSRSIVYDVDLTDLSAPKSSLLVIYKNESTAGIPCVHWDGDRKIVDERSYPIDRCYWNYLRVYVKDGTNLLAATPHEIPGEWMILERNVPARVDLLDEELDGIQAVGTLLVVPGGESVSTSFDFELPLSVIMDDPVTDNLIYRLKVKKQPGTLTTPVTIRIHLPYQALVESVSVDAVVENNDLLINTDLNTDVDIVVVFR